MTFDPRSTAGLLCRGDFADLYVEESDHLTILCEDGRLDDIVQGSSSGAGLRYLNGRETLYGHLDCARPLSQGFNADERGRLTKMAASVSSHLKIQHPRAVTRPIAFREHPSRLPPQDTPLKEKLRILQRAECAARIGPWVRQVTIRYGERVKRVGYLNALGESYEQVWTYVTLTVQVTAEKNGLIQTAYESAGGVLGLELFDETSPEKIAALAAKRAVAKLSAPSAPLGEMSVVVASEAGGTLIHEAIGHALEADGIQDGTSPHFAGKIGKVVANEKVTVMDDPTRLRHRGSFYFDDEGTPAERTVLVQNGVLKTYLYDRMTAQRDRRESNGHGRRESYAHKPIPRMSNTFIAPGLDDPKEIVRSLRKGILVTRMGGGQVNTATGDFVFEVEEGFWVENGRAKHMIRGANLLGNGPETLRTIDKVGNDIGWSIGTCGKEGQGAPVSDGVPTLRIPKLVIGGVDSKEKSR